MMIHMPPASWIDNKKNSNLAHGKWLVVAELRAPRGAISYLLWKIQKYDKKSVSIFGRRDFCGSSSPLRGKYVFFSVPSLLNIVNMCFAEMLWKRKIRHRSTPTLQRRWISSRVFDLHMMPVFSLSISALSSLTFRFSQKSYEHRPTQHFLFLPEADQTPRHLFTFPE